MTERDPRLQPRIRFASYERDYPGIRELWTRLYYPSYVAAEEPFFSWQFRQAPGVEPPETCMAVLDDGHIQGQLGFFPVEFTCRGERQRGCMLTHWDTEEAWRAAGMGGRLFLHVREQFPNMAVLGLSPDSVKIFPSIGFQFCDGIDRAVWIYDAARASEFPPPDFQAGFADFLRGRFALPRGGRCHAVGFSDLDRLAACWTRFARPLGLAVDRSAAYLRWRYADHPLFKYEVVTAGPDYSGFAVVRRENILDTSHYVLRITDLIAPETIGERDALLAAVHEFGRQHEMVFADFFCTYAPLMEDLAARGWLLNRDHDRFQFPRLFQPLEHRYRRGINMAVRVRPAAGIGFDQMYFTKSDGDQDRPVGRARPLYFG
jgi:hypothetical protein